MALDRPGRPLPASPFQRVPAVPRVPGLGVDFFTVGSGLPVVMAHRGRAGISAAGVRENTAEAFLEAIRAGARWIETDVQLSADQDLVLCHNPLIDGEPVARLSTKELRRRGIVTLEEIHRLLPPEIGFNVEVKLTIYAPPGPARPNLFDRVNAWAEEAGRERRLLLTSFSPPLMELPGSTALGWLRNRSGNYQEGLAWAMWSAATVAALHVRDILDVSDQTPPVEELLGAIRRGNIAVLAWGVEAVDVPALVARGVTGLCTDDVVGVVAAVQALSPLQLQPLAALGCGSPSPAPAPATLRAVPRPGGERTGERMFRGGTAR